MPLDRQHYSLIDKSEKSAQVQGEQNWQAGHGGTHRRALLVGEDSPIPTERPHSGGGYVSLWTL